MSANSIEVEGISKRYAIGARKADSIADALSSLIDRSNGDEKRHFWALRDISFNVEEGQAVGVIGKNGAGKSTLLKILSRITYPTTGRVKIYGRVSSLLEVGTGFHPELSGRENVYLNGTILGMKRAEVKAKFDEIVEFSGVSKFIDTPIKHYSSGMKVRLAFAVAAHLEPEILIIDEVLAVGDAEFQKKCLGKMQDVATQGRTVLFVSHNMEAVEKLTTKCAVVESGRLAFIGPTSAAVNSYLYDKDLGLPWSYSNFSGKGDLFMKEISVVTSSKDGNARWGEQISIEFVLMVNQETRGTCFSFQIVNSDHVNVGYYWLYASDYEIGDSVGERRITCLIPRLKLFEGQYWITTWLSDRRGQRMIENLERICSFHVSVDNIVHDEYPWAPRNAVFLEESTWVIGNTPPVLVAMPKLNKS